MGHIAGGTYVKTRKGIQSNNNTSISERLQQNRLIIKNKSCVRNI